MMAERRAIELPDEDRLRSAITESYHVEKYIAPGSAAVLLLFLLPWYLVVGVQLDLKDVGTLIIGVFVAGHFIESIRVYAWLPQVRGNFREFSAKVDGLTHDWRGDAVKLREFAKSAIFTIIRSDERTEFGWNLARWQKMIVIGIIFGFGGMLWIAIAVMASLTADDPGPLVRSVNISLFRPDATSWSVGFSIAAAALHIACAAAIVKNALKRQVRANDYYFGLIAKYKLQLRERAETTFAKSENDD